MAGPPEARRARKVLRRIPPKPRGASHFLIIVLYYIGMKNESLKQIEELEAQVRGVADRL